MQAMPGMSVQTKANVSLGRQGKEEDSFRTARVRTPSLNEQSVWLSCGFTVSPSLAGFRRYRGLCFTVMVLSLAVPAPLSAQSVAVPPITSFADAAQFTETYLKSLPSLSGTLKSLG